MDHAAMDQIVNEHFGYEAADDVDGVLLSGDHIHAERVWVDLNAIAEATT